jgi:hypothetical protein
MYFLSPLVRQGFRAPTVTVMHRHMSMLLCDRKSLKLHEAKCFVRRLWALTALLPPVRIQKATHIQAVESRLPPGLLL